MTVFNYQGCPILSLFRTLHIRSELEMDTQGIVENEESWGGRLRHA